MSADTEIKHPSVLNVTNGKITIHHLSPSSLNAFAGPWGCELAWRYKYLDRLPRKPGTGSLLAGRAWDAAVQAAHETPFIEPGQASQALLDEVENVLGSTTEEWTVEHGEQGQIRSSGAKAAELYVERDLPTIHTLAVQKRVEARFNEVDWTVMGYLDQIETRPAGGVCIVDQKATIGTSRKYDTNEAYTSLQLNIYDLALRQEGIVPSSMGFRWSRMLKTKHEVLSAFAPVTVESQQRTLEVVATIGDRIEHACETGNFAPTAFMDGRYKCSARFCDHYDHCPFGRRARISQSLATDAADAGL